MKIQGLQKLTLLDFPGHVSCTVFTGGCNFRCPFCHNASLVVREEEPDLSEEELFSFLKKRQGILDGVCVTGGEPLLQPDLAAFLKKVRELGYLIKLDTNGSRPQKLKELVEQGLVDYVAMDIKNSPARYAETVGLSRFELAPVKESVSYLLSGAVEYEFRTTVVKELHDKPSFQEIADWISGAKRYYLQQFTDSGDLIEPGFHACSEQEMKEFLELVRPKIPSAQLRGM